MSEVKEDLYPKKILEYMEGYLVSKTLFTACELGVFDLLQDSERPLSAAEVSKCLDTSEDGMDRLLSACAGLELLNTQPNTHGQKTVVYSNTQMSSVFLTKSSPRSLFHSIDYNSNTMYLCWHYLTHAVREGRNQYEKAFGVSSKDLFEAMYRSEEEMLKFMQLMNSIWNICGKDVVTTFDLSSFKSVYDLGGCSGALARQCVQHYPDCTVTIFDLPRVVQMCQEQFISSGDEQIRFHEGDFFKDTLPEADLYILARILHDWTNERSLELLTKIHKSCRAGGGVLLVEALLSEDNRGPLTAQLYSLNMLVQTEGRERKGSEYAALLTTAGFTSVNIHRTGKIYDSILALK
ncbi:acetylserotonin O-methyltransferase [Hoplias malabaricus]|uniref:acetylserotonin O-methyltransferase n=1 Tax=Hoplias malabaricus TaxID=27720 RepID=UPI003461D7E8